METAGRVRKETRFCSAENTLKIKFKFHSKGGTIDLMLCCCLPVEPCMTRHPTIPAVSPMVAYLLVFKTNDSVSCNRER